MIADNFDSRTRANMDIALERACALLPAGAEQHENRRYIAGRILKYAEGGDGLTEAGGRAAYELCERLARPKGSRAKAHNKADKRGSVSPHLEDIG